MLHRQGFTLMEMIVVLVIISVCVVVVFPNFTAPTEQAKALTAKNNLLAMYSAERNYNNNNGSFKACADIASCNSALALNIQDDGSFTYSCNTSDPSGFACTSARTSGVISIVVKNSPVQLKANINPNCSASLAASYSWCP